MSHPKSNRRARPLALLALGLASARLAADENPSFAAARLGGEIVVDGVLDEPAWERATPIALAWEVEPGDNLPARIATDCRIGYDADALHFACRADEPEPASLRAFLTERDATGVQDEIGLVLDPIGDARTAYLFSTTALGTQRDERFDQEANLWDAGWNAVWRAAARIDADGVTIEASIPFRAFRLDARAEALPWRFWLFRFRPRSEGVVFRSMRRDRAVACQLCQANRLTGVREVDAGRGLALLPTVTALRSDRADERGRLVDGEIDDQIGLDLRLDPTPGSTVALTWNPDFSQIESDVGQLDVNPRFALFFPERRPFFLEGAELFATPLQLFESRSVVDPVGGLKATARIGAFDLGTVVARDERAALLLPGADGSRTLLLDREVTTAVARIESGPRSHFGDRLSLGALAISRAGGDYRNRLLAFDALARPHPAWTLRAQLVGTDTIDPEAIAAELDRPRASEGFGFTLAAEGESRNWQWGATLRGRDPGFRADAGFVPLVDVRGASARLTRLFWGDGKRRFTQVGLFGELFHDQRWSGGLLSQGGLGEVWIDGPLQSSLFFQPSFRRERFAGRDFDLTGSRLGFRIRPSAAFAAQLDGSWGDAIDFARALPADRLRLFGTVELRLGRRGALTLRHTDEQLARGGRTVVAGTLSELRAAFHFDRRLSVRATLGRSEREERTDGDALERSREATSEVVLSWVLDPERVLYLGTDERRGEPGEGDFAQRSLVPLERTWFVKLGYGFRPGSR